MALTIEEEELLYSLLLAEEKENNILDTLYSLSNATYIPLYSNQSRYLILKGGGGSGKSIFAGQKILHRITTEPGHRILVVRKVAKTLKQSCWEQLKEQISEYYDINDFNINLTDFSIKYKPNGSVILFSGLDDVEKLKSIMRITSIWIEEATELEEGDYNQLDIRLRGQSKHHRQIIATFNPVSISHWLKKRFFDNSDPDATTSETTYRDNSFLDKKSIEVLEKFKDTDPYYYNVYCLGQWGVIGKTVFDAAKLSYRLSYLSKVEPCNLLKLENIYIQQEDVNANWLIYKKPKLGRQYCIGSDVAEGNENGDYSTAQVMDVVTLEQVAVFRGHVDPDQLSVELEIAGYYYNTALINVEVNMESGTVRNLEKANYPKMYMREQLDDITHTIKKKFGWRTTETSRRMIISNLVEYVRDHSELLNCPITIDEMLSFIRNKNGRPEGQSGKHDDLVMALAICLEACLSGQQSRGSFEKVFDYVKLEKMEKDIQDDFARANKDLQIVIADKLKLWRE